MSRIIANEAIEYPIAVISKREPIEFERVTDKPLCACIAGTLNSTQKDKHGHIVPGDLYPQFIESLKQQPERRVMSIHHNRDDPIGEILWAGIREDDDVVRLVGGVGIYEEVRDRLGEIENLGGFSITLVGYENIDENTWSSDLANFAYRGLGEDYHRLKEAVENNGAPARFEVQKSAEGAFLFDAVADNIPLLLELALVVYSVHRDRKKSKEEEDTEPQIVVNGDVIHLGDKDIAEFLDSLSDAIGEDIWLDPDVADELIEALDDDEAAMEFEVNPEYE